MAAKHENVFTLNARIPFLTDKIRNASASGLGMKLKDEGPYGNGGVCFRLKHGVSFTSWGENITIILSPLGMDQTSVMIRSECALPTQIIDYGKNKQNVEKLIRYLSV